MPTPPRRTPPERTSLLVVLLLVFGLPALVRVDTGVDPPPAGLGDGTKPRGVADFDDTPRQQLDAETPRWLFIGNSNTYTRIDEAVVAERIGGPALTQAHAGTSGIHWALQLHNHVLAAAHRPERVFVFFRDGELTDLTDLQPDLRWSLSRDPEPVVADLYDAHCTTLSNELRGLVWRGVHAAWPLAGVRSDDLRDVADAVAPSAVFGGARPHDFHVELGRRYGLGHLRTDATDAFADQAGARLSPDAFEASLGCTPLRAILEAADAGLPITLVRVQRRTWPDGPAEEAEAKQIFAVARAHGLRTLDFSGDPRVLPSWYGTSDHIAPQFEAAWTTHFVDVALDGD